MCHRSNHTHFIHGPWPRDIGVDPFGLYPDDPEEARLCLFHLSKYFYMFGTPLLGGIVWSVHS